MCPTTLFLAQYSFLSIQTQSAQSFNHTVVLSTNDIYITLSPVNLSHSIHTFKNCLDDIQNILFTNKLKLNPDKTELILIGIKTIINNSFRTFQSIFLTIRFHQDKMSRTLQWCSNLSLSDYVSQIIKFTRVHAKDLYRIHPLLGTVTSFRKCIKTHLFSSGFPT